MVKFSLWSRLIPMSKSLFKRIYILIGTQLRPQRKQVDQIAQYSTTRMQMDRIVKQISGLDCDTFAETAPTDEFVRVVKLALAVMQGKGRAAG